MGTREPCCINWPQVRPRFWQQCVNSTTRRSLWAHPRFEQARQARRRVTERPSYCPLGWVAPEAQNASVESVGLWRGNSPLAAIASRAPSTRARAISSAAS